MKGVWKDKLDARDISRTSCVQANIIFSKLDEIITHNKVKTNQITVEKKEQILHIVEDGFP